MSTKLSQQAAAAAELKKMPGPKEFNPEQAMSAMLAGGPAAMIADQKAQFDAANDVKMQQVAYYNAYTQAMSEVDGTTPSFGPEALGLPSQAGASSPQAGRMGALSGEAPGLAGTGVGLTGALAGAPASSSGALDSALVTQAGAHAETTASGASTGAGTSSGAAPGAGAASSGSSSNVGQQLGLGAVGAGLGFAAAKTLNAGSRSGAKQVQPGQTSASSDMAHQSTQSGVTSATPAGQAKPTAMGVGAPGMTGAPIGGAGVGATNQQEEEHKHASFLVEPDPDNVFGAAETASQPVIGSWDD